MRHFAPSALPSSTDALRSAILSLCSPCVTPSTRCVLSFFSLGIFFWLHFDHSDLSARLPLHNTIVSRTPASLALKPLPARATALGQSFGAVTSQEMQ
jgi:hypothetical protein